MADDLPMSTPVCESSSSEVPGRGRDGRASRCGPRDCAFPSARGAGGRGGRGGAGRRDGGRGPSRAAAADLPAPRDDIPPPPSATPQPLSLPEQLAQLRIGSDARTPPPMAITHSGNLVHLSDPSIVSAVLGPQPNQGVGGGGMTSPLRGFAPTARPQHAALAAAPQILTFDPYPVAPIAAGRGGRVGGSLAGRGLGRAGLGGSQTARASGGPSLDDLIGAPRTSTAGAGCVATRRRRRML
ncbi:hypothetical protein T492DRAFT_907440 [Pavlovales sp. CCMP2436]|nr:hypothetical protein T492DRAFT_907440 [Pavlovales sp. CCMP2436]